MGTYEKLYLANNLETLDLLAKRDCDAKSLNFQQICNFLGKLYKSSQLNVLDQEKTYILLARYLTLYNHLKNTQPDKKFVELRFGSEYEKVLTQYKGIKKSLEERYTAAKATSVPPKPKVEEKETVPQEKPQRVFKGEFINCTQLFSALQEKYNILLVDARPENDFAESRINQPNCINVPDHCITPGLSANALGKRLPASTQGVWKQRETYDVIVLYDWNTSSDNVALTKLSKLRSALVDWDLNRNYNEPPVILNGGYLELLQTYPTICLNPHVYLFQRNNELDELLELDNIEYPTESDNKVLVMGVPEETQMEVDEPITVTQESLIEENNEIAKSWEKVKSQIRLAQSERKKLNGQCNKETDANNIDVIETKIQFINAELSKLFAQLAVLMVKRDDVRQKLREHYNYELEGELDMEDVRNGQKMEIDDSDKLKDIIDEERNKELKKARALKPKKPKLRSTINNKVHDPKKPAINRATKPTIYSYSSKPQVEELPETTAGEVGLKNICNTCYMNTIIQCVKSVPELKDLFCSARYTEYNIRNPAAIIHETADLIRKLYSEEEKFLESWNFYDKACQLEATYRLGHHEDCMEFFLFLLNHLTEDCLYDVSVPNILTPKQKAWYNQFEGKNSVFMDLFYHQIRIKQHCLYCKRKTYKFEIESTFMLSVPEHDFTIEQLMNDYMADYVIPDYCCSKCRKPVNNQKQICYEPKIMVIVLKRYRQVMQNGSLTVKKTESKAHFPTKNLRLGKAVYDLNAIALHAGDMNQGHYTAACLTPNGWHEFNDMIVKPMNINDDGIKGKACAFFYSMCD